MTVYEAASEFLPVSPDWHEVALALHSIGRQACGEALGPDGSIEADTPARLDLGCSLLLIVAKMHGAQRVEDVFDGANKCPICSASNDVAILSEIDDSEQVDHMEATAIRRLMRQRRTSRRSAGSRAK